MIHGVMRKGTDLYVMNQAKRWVPGMVALVALLVFASSLVSLAESDVAAAHEGATQTCIDAKQVFDILFEALKETRASWGNNVWSSGGFLFLALGWLLTAKHAHMLMRTRPRVRRGAMLVAGLLACSVLGLNIEIAFRARGILERLASNAFVIDNALLSELPRFGVGFVQASASCVVLGLLFALVIGTLHSLRGGEASEDDEADSKPSVR